VGDLNVNANHCPLCEMLVILALYREESVQSEKHGYDVRTVQKTIKNERRQEK
jgi:Zn ribbon nucleic-acid-binding protein